MRLGHVPYDRQPEPEATMSATAAFVQPRESIEDPIQRVGRQAGSIVLHRQAGA